MTNSETPTYNNKIAHFAAGFMIASACEYKDAKYTDNWDWLDWVATVTGAITAATIKTVCK